MNAPRTGAGLLAALLLGLVPARGEDAPRENGLKEIAPKPETRSDEAPTRFEVAYTLSFLGVGVGKTTLRAERRGERYALTLDGGLSGLANMFFSGTGRASSSGRLGPALAVPAAFEIDGRYGTNPVRVRVRFEGGAVRSASVEPPPGDKPDRVPVGPADKAGVTDPVGMLAIPAPPGPLTPAACDRRIPVFDGATRADLVLSRGAVVALDAGPYRGQALDCRVRWVPVAGHRRYGSSVKRMAENDELRVRLAPAPGGLLLPLAISVATGWGTARIDAATWPAVR